MRKSKDVYVSSCGEILYKGVPLKKCTSASHGYATVFLDGKNVLVHRLVAQAWILNPYGKRTVNHKDGNKLNNRLDNLEWATDSENNRHSIEVLGRKPSRGRMKVSDRVAQEILDLKGRIKQQEIANMYKVKKSLVADIHAGRRRIEQWEKAA